LDNLKLSDSLVDAEYTLEHLLVEGHAEDGDTQEPPRGLQFVLGTEKHANMVDTITMANLGYLQLKGAPGIWRLKIRDGRSDQIYKLQEIERGIKGNTVLVDSFEGVTLHPTVNKKPGMQDKDVLQEDDGKDAGLWNNLKSSLFGSKSSPDTTINVFSVASGHLYERFLAIMMLSVKKQTKNPVKFWLIENFLSPSFLQFLPHLAKAFDFQYELVTYKWPHWLRKQTEKQRIIWGYKILFLDVLFPLSLDKVIFVDAVSLFFLLIDHLGSSCED
jgi:UDP-glucose:glycoprotein glucosyltransferase